MNRKPMAIVLMMMSVCGWGQTALKGTWPPAYSGTTFPLKCGKYQHEQLTPEHCANTCLPGATVCTSECRSLPAEDKCVDDMHVVTEREWQEVMERLKTLEAPAANKPTMFHAVQCSTGYHLVQLCVDLDNKGNLVNRGIPCRDGDPATFYCVKHLPRK